MLFNSLPFLFVFLPFVLIGFHLLGRFGRTAAIGWLSLVSIVFYARWRVDFVPLLLGSILFNYAASRLIVRTTARPRLQTLVLALAITGNLGLLGFYKYLFPLISFLHATAILGPRWTSVILPLGISFFTFTQIGYLIDLRQGTAGPQKFISYTLFVTFFPHLIAGPILHHGEMMPQFSENRRLRSPGG